MSTLHLALLPRDGWFCKDGRGWYTSENGRSGSLPWPPPATLRGALRGAFGRAIIEQTGEPLEPADWEARSRGVGIRRIVTLHRDGAEPFATEHRRWPVPMDAVHLREETEVHCLVPRRRGEQVGTLGASDHAPIEALAWPSMPRGKPAAGPVFWTDAEMCAWLRGETVQKREPRDTERTPVRRTDIHLAVDPGTLAAVPSMLHSSEITEGLSRTGEWGVALEVDLPEEAPAVARGPLHVGGRRRIADVETIGASLFAAPAGLCKPGRGLRLVLVTPAEFDQGWLPDGFAVDTLTGSLPGVTGAVVLRAALVPRPMALSTWDIVARAPRKTRRMVAPGSVYFFEKRDGTTFTEAEIRGLWMARLGRDRDEGLGLVLPGTWDLPNVGGA